jgi:hypothetical protein
MFWDDRSDFGKFYSQTTNKETIRLPGKFKEQIGAMLFQLQSATAELCKEMKKVRKETKNVFQYDTSVEGLSILVTTNSLIHVRLIPSLHPSLPPEKTQNYPVEDLDYFPYLQQEINSRYWRSSLFGTENANRKLNALPSRERIPAIMDNIRQHLP